MQRPLSDWRGRAVLPRWRQPHPHLRTWEFLFWLSEGWPCTRSAGAGQLRSVQRNVVFIADWERGVSCQTTILRRLHNIARSWCNAEACRALLDLSTWMYGRGQAPSIAELDQPSRSTYAFLHSSAESFCSSPRSFRRLSWPLNSTQEPFRVDNFLCRQVHARIGSTMGFRLQAWIELLFQWR